MVLETGSLSQQLVQNSLVVVPGQPDTLALAVWAGFSADPNLQYIRPVLKERGQSVQRLL